MTSDYSTVRRRNLAVGACMMPLLVAFALMLAGCGGSPGPVPLEGSSYHFDGWGVSLAWWANVIGDGQTKVIDGQPAGQPAYNGKSPWPPRYRDKVISALFGAPGQASGHGWGAEIHPLGLNILRYNVGGSPSGTADDAEQRLPPDCRSFRDGAVVPSPIQSKDGQVDLRLDARQIDILVAAKKLIDDGNGRHAILEAFANSPPWWLTSNGCPAGQPSVKAPPQPGPNPSPGSKQPPQFYPSNPFGPLCLPATCVSDDASTLADAHTYARYLLDVVSAFHQRMGIDFKTVEPFNEPNVGFWGNCSDHDPTKCPGGCNPDNCQEGANFSPDVQAEVVDALCGQLSNSEYAGLSTGVSANDENSLDRIVSSSGSPPWLRGCLAQVNTHGYGGLKDRAALRDLAGKKRLWMSEYGVGPCDQSASGETCSALQLSKQIAGDLQDLRPAAWVYWQALEAADDGHVGLLQDADFPEPPSSFDRLTPTLRFWALAQYTRFIRDGATIYPVRGSGSANANNSNNDGVRVVVARNATGELVVVATNPATDRPQSLNLSLAKLTETGTATPHQVTFQDRNATPSDPPATELRGGVLDASLPARTITTYVIGSKASAPALATAGLSWKLIPCGLPCPALITLATFDPNHAGTLALAGPSFTGSKPSSDVTWSFDGARWTRMSPATSPGVDTLRASMAFDAATGQVVLLGATQAGDAETWTWDGTNWTQQHPTTTPDVANMAMASMAYDPHSKRIVLFGGQASDGGDSGATWTWDGSTWTQVSSAPGPPNAAPSPSARAAAALTYDPKLNGLLLFGGSSTQPAPNYNAQSPTLHRDTWLWDGTHWTLKDSGQSADAPPPGNYHMITDQATQTPLLLGTDKGSKQWQQWAWDGTHWQQLPGATTPQQTTPPLAELIAVTYDTTHGAEAFGPAELAAGTQASSTSELISTWQGTVTTDGATAPIARSVHACGTAHVFRITGTITVTGTSCTRADGVFRAAESAPLPAKVAHTPYHRWSPPYMVATPSGRFTCRREPYGLAGSEHNIRCNQKLERVNWATVHD